MQYRCKSVPRVLEEFRTLATRFGTHRLHVVDNIISRDHLKTVIPALAEEGAPYSLFYETKANLSAEEIELLAAAGVRRIQPGIESLSLGALKLMEKGTTPVTNLQLLRRARWQGIFVTWNFLWQLPGDDPAWYSEVAKWLPLVFHLQAPNTLVPVRFDRFSPYHQRPEAYGLSLTPTPGLRHIYPVEDGELANLAYYFEDRARAVERLFKAMDPGSREFARLVQTWMGIWGRIRSARPDAPEPPRLEMRVADGVVDVIDTRPVRRAGHIRLEGLEAEVLMRCDLATSRVRLAEELGAYRESAIDLAIERLSSLGLILALDERLLALPTHPQRRPYNDVSQYPGGYVIRETRAAGELRPTPA
jgi:magnesium-protoporphyrin IX monomethyl ester (oxidative) cyclase